MGWLPTSVLLVVGIIGLALLVAGLVGALHRARAAAHTLSVALDGRRTRLRAGAAELSAWRAEHRARRHGPAAPTDHDA
ncbi:hypothetical protein [Pseudonocardia acaciae]|uniref:hypothetical protein n=1 Tax=Pseudonocardia acaciae TaxID=551276 RepID=UPI00048A9B92|nr:hypothetical protein [Pseudonocardia acaciae]